MKKAGKWIIKYFDGLVSLVIAGFMLYNKNWWAAWGFIIVFFRELKEKENEEYIKFLEESRDRWYHKYVEAKYGRKEDEL